MLAVEESFFLLHVNLMRITWIFVKKFLRIMRGTQGALIVASALLILLGFSVLWRNVAR
jgi:hypothetical protein